VGGEKRRKRGASPISSATGLGTGDVSARHDKYRTHVHIAQAPICAANRAWLAGGSRCRTLLSSFVSCNALHSRLVSGRRHSLQFPPRRSGRRSKTGGPPTDVTGDTAHGRSGRGRGGGDGRAHPERIRCRGARPDRSPVNSLRRAVASPGGAAARRDRAPLPCRRQGTPGFLGERGRPLRFAHKMLLHGAAPSPPSSRRGRRRRASTWPANAPSIRVCMVPS
jgi:hypothetical protein